MSFGEYANTIKNYTDRAEQKFSGLISSATQYLGSSSIFSHSSSKSASSANKCETANRQMVSDYLINHYGIEHPTKKQIDDGLDYAYANGLLKNSCEAELGSSKSLTKAKPKETYKKTTETATNVLNYEKIKQKDPNARELFLIGTDDNSAEGTVDLMLKARSLESCEIKEPQQATARHISINDGNVWSAAKQELQHQGLKPTNAQILALAKELAVEKGISVPEWGINGA